MAGRFPPRMNAAFFSFFYCTVSSAFYTPSSCRRAAWLFAMHRRGSHASPSHVFPSASSLSLSASAVARSSPCRASRSASSTRSIEQPSNRTSPRAPPPLMLRPAEQLRMRHRVTCPFAPPLNLRREAAAASHTDGQTDTQWSAVAVVRYEPCMLLAPTSQQQEVQPRTRRRSSRLAAPHPP